MAKELYSQIGYLQVVESAANTLTFNGLSVFSNVLGQKGMLLHRIEYYLPPATIDLLAADNDALLFGMSGTNTLTSITLDNAEVYDYSDLKVNEFGTGANVLLINGVHIKDYGNLPGGGKLVPADRLYAWCKGENLNSAATVNARFDFTILDLSAQDYLELAQSLRVLK